MLHLPGLFDLPAVAGRQFTPEIEAFKSQPRTLRARPGSGRRIPKTGHGDQRGLRRLAVTNTTGNKI